jgi:hypothetical protein
MQRTQRKTKNVKKKKKKKKKKNWIEKKIGEGEE